MRLLLSSLLLASTCFALSLAKTDCEEHRDRELKSNSRVKLVPKCTENGEYEAMQCYENSPFCSCWRPNGSAIIQPVLKLKSCNCIIHRDRVVSRRLIGTYKPQCEADGTYSRTQCHGGMGYCWCVDENGNKVNKNLNDC